MVLPALRVVRMCRSRHERRPKKIPKAEELSRKFYNGRKEWPCGVGRFPTLGVLGMPPTLISTRWQEYAGIKC